MKNNGGARGSVQQLTTAGPTANKQFVLLVLFYAQCIWAIQLKNWCKNNGFS